MSFPLQQRLSALRSRLRRLTLLYGLCTTATVVLAAVVFLGLADYLIRWEDRGLRIIATLLFTTAAVVAAYRHLYLPHRVHLSDLHLAELLERYLPDCSGRLASAVEFAGQEENDLFAGSASLRRAVVEQTAAALENTSFDELLDPRPVRRAFTGTFVVFLAVAALAVLSPQSSWLSLIRLGNPFGGATWPRENHLAVASSVEIVPKGGVFEVELKDENGEPLPGEMLVHYRWEGDRGATYETVPLRSSGDKAILRRENVARSFAYRVEGGDDRTMPWHKVRAVESPRIESMHVKITPPRYSGWPVEETDGEIIALAGSRLEIAAAANKLLRSAELVLEGKRRFPARISDNGMRFTVDDPLLLVQNSGVCGFDLLDADGLKIELKNERDIQVIVDRPPTIRIEQPTANIFVMPEAVAELRLRVVDDLALKDVQIVAEIARPSISTGENPENSNQKDAVPSIVKIPLYAGPKDPLQRAGANARKAEGEEKYLEYAWDLAALNLSPGASIQWCVEAADYYPHSARSDRRTISVVGRQEYQDRFYERQNVLFNELDRALKMEQTAQARIESERIQLEEKNRFSAADLDQLRASEIGQREVRRLLTAPPRRPLSPTPRLG